MECLNFDDMVLILDADVVVVDVRKFLCNFVFLGEVARVIAISNLFADGFVEIEFSLHKLYSKRI